MAKLPQPEEIDLLEEESAIERSLQPVRIEKSWKMMIPPWVIITMSFSLIGTCLGIVLLASYNESVRTFVLDLVKVFAG